MMLSFSIMAISKDNANHPRAGWEEDSKAIAAAGDDELEWPYFENEADENWVWEGDLGLPERRTVRLILLDQDNRLLLMQVNDPQVKEAHAHQSNLWVTLGGRLEDGETVFQAAQREAEEETGQSSFESGPAIWYGEQILTIRGEPTQLKETFVVMRTRSTALANEKWTAEERQVIKEMRWWTLDEMRTTRDTILPKKMLKLLPDIMAGHYPAEVQSISL